MRRILVTGSRGWADVVRVRAALLLHGPGIVVHGRAQGLDEIANEVACIWHTLRDPQGREWPKPEAHPAEWRRLGRSAGPRRNQEMVNLGADVCLAFPMRSSRGTYDCAARATAAGIPVVWVLGPGVTETERIAQLAEAQVRL